MVVMAVTSQDTPPAPDYFAEAVVDNATPYVGQQITYQFRFYDAVDIANAQYQPPDFESFWQVTKRALNAIPQQINNRQYTVTSLDTALYPTRPGTIIIPSPIILLLETVFRAQEQLSANTVTIDVKPLPDGAPTGFTGAVGQFDLSATLDRQSANLGEPFTVRLTLTGTGNVEQLTLPNWSVPDDWRFYTNPSTFTIVEEQGLVVGSKTYEYLLLPNQIGTNILPVMTLHFFDPVTVSYRFVSTQPVTLEVLPPAVAPAQPPSPVAGPLQEAPPLALKPLVSVGRDNIFFPGAISWLLWLLPPLGVGCSWWWIRRRERLAAQFTARQRSLALHHAQTRLQHVAKHSNPAAYHSVREAVLGYFADKLGRRLDELVEADLQMILDPIQVAPTLSKRILLCLEWADEGQYAPVNTVDLPTLISRTSETLSVIDSAWTLK